MKRGIINNLLEESLNSLPQFYNKGFKNNTHLISNCSLIAVYEAYINLGLKYFRLLLFFFILNLIEYICVLYN